MHILAGLTFPWQLEQLVTENVLMKYYVQSIQLHGLCFQNIDLKNF